MIRICFVLTFRQLPYAFGPSACEVLRATSRSRTAMQRRIFTSTWIEFGIHFDTPRAKWTLFPFL